MDWWLVWLISASAFVLLGFVGYHFSVRTLRLFAALLLAMVSLIATRYGVVHSAAGPTDVVNSFIRGFNDLSISFFQPLLGRDVHVPGRFGWFVILAVLVFGYRELEVWAMRWESPAVDTSALGGDQPGAQSSGPPDEPDEGTTDAQRHDRLVAELRFRLPAVSVRAPAILPGGTRSNGLASIAENSGVSGSGLAGAIIRFFGALWPNPRRYQVRVWIEPRERSGHGRPRDMPAVRVTVDVENPRTGESIATKTLAADDCDQAASMIAGYVARHIFKEDPTAPPWCVGSFDGGDLAVMLLAGQQRVAPASPDEIRRSRCQQISMLEKCKLVSGVARYELAQLYDLEGNHVKALRLHALNREDYLRFYRGRYRLGMSLEMIADPEFELLEPETTELLDTLRILDRCGLMKDVARRYDRIDPGRLPPDLSNRMLLAARYEQRAVRRQLTLGRVIWGMFLHRDERGIRKMYWPLRERQSFHDGARVAELLVAIRQCQPGRAGRIGYNTRRAMHVAAAITGDSAAIEACLKGSPAQYVTELLEQERPPFAIAQRTRWLPWQRRTPSWQAAYNTACLYAALKQSYSCTDAADATLAQRAVSSLIRAVNDPDCEMERPWDWISTDPDFSCLRQSRIFRDFLDSQKVKDYPADRACVFCGAPDADVTITRDLIFADWLDQGSASAAAAAEVSCKRGSQAKVGRDWAATEAAGPTLRAVCGSCAADWMPSLDSVARSLLVPIIEGAEARLTVEDQIAIATWAALKAAMFEHLWTDDPVLTAADREVIMRQERLPAGIRVLLAAAAPGTNPRQAIGYVDEPGGQPGRALCLTIAIGHLVVQVFAGLGADPLARQVAARVGIELIEIFPSQSGVVPWPPRHLASAAS
jgi:hypothetical protein